ncbi:MAG: hypothetical protein KAR83_09585, partial [Thermodesulfovibrionales bacterium]|nr:hypothetical protein [Thermodesulfovibrionales bacterium]
MKKLLALMVAMIMVFGLASFAVAEIELSGDARLRGTMIDNPDYDSDTDDSSRWYDSRIRLNVTGTNDDGAGVKLRFTARENNWDGADGNTIRFDGDDYAYIFVPVSDDWTLSGGFMPANWGHKFWSWGSANARLKVTGKLDVATVGAFTQKVNDTFGEDDLNDYDVNALFGITQLGEFKVGGILVMGKDDTTTTPDVSTTVTSTLYTTPGECANAGGTWKGGAGGSCKITTTIPGTDGGDGDGGMKIDLFFQGKLGDITVLGEVAQNGGDLYDSSSEDAKLGGFVAAAMELDTLKVSGAFAMTSNGYTATKYFAPTVLIGSAQPTAQFDLGECGATGLSAYGLTCDTMALVLNVDTKL